MTSFLDFPSISASDWREKVTTDLKGRPFDSLIATTSEGIDIRPIYTAEDRVPSAIPSLSAPWVVHQDFFGSDPEAINRHILDALKAGVPSIGLTAPTDLEEAKKTLKDVQVDIIDLFFSTRYPSEVFGQLTELFYEHGTSFAHMSGGILFDPLGELIRTGSWYESEQRDMDALKAHLGRCGPHADLCASVIDGVSLADAGAEHVTELAVVLAQLNEYIEQCKGSVSLDGLVQKVCIKLSLDTDFYLSASKIKAFRLLWQTLLEGHGISTTPCSIMAANSSWDIAPIDQYTNLLRLTTAAMAGIMGGCDHLSLAPFDGECTPFSLRMSRNIQLLLMNESHLDKSIDPLNGAYLFESMSQDLAEKAWKEFKRIESKGGLLSVVLDGSLQQGIRRTAELRLAAREAGEDDWLGVNLYVSPTESMPVGMAMGEAPHGVTTGLAFPQKTVAQ